MITGSSNLTWFQGIVEENNDPLGNGRVQIRVFGIHPPYDQNLIDTKDLPWAILLNSTYGAIHRVPDLGEWVMGISLDGQDHTNLLVIGTIPGMQRSSPAGSTNGPNPYAKPNQDMINKIGNPPIPPQMTGEDLQLTPILIHHATQLADNMQTPDKEGFNEPTIPTGDTQYKTTVWNASYDGSFIEVNDNPNDGFINIIHKSGSGITMDNNGNVKIKAMGDSWGVSAGNHKEFTAGRKDIIVESGNYTLTTLAGDLIINSIGDLSISSHGNVNISCAREMTFNAGESVQIIAPKVGIHAIADNLEMTAKNMTINESGNAIVETTSHKVVNVSGNLDAIVGGSVAISSDGFSAMGGGNASLDYAQIHLNSGELNSPDGLDVSIGEINKPEPPIAKAKSGSMVVGSPSGGSSFDMDESESERAIA